MAPYGATAGRTAAAQQVDEVRRRLVGRVLKHVPLGQLSVESRRRSSPASFSLCGLAAVSARCALVLVPGEEREVVAKSPSAATASSSRSSLVFARSSAPVMQGGPAVPSFAVAPVLIVDLLSAKAPLRLPAWCAAAANCRWSLSKSPASVGRHGGVELVQVAATVARACRSLSIPNARGSSALNTGGDDVRPVLVEALAEAVDFVAPPTLGRLEALVGVLVPPELGEPGQPAAATRREPRPQHRYQRSAWLADRAAPLGPAGSRQ